MAAVCRGGTGWRAALLGSAPDSKGDAALTGSSIHALVCPAGGGAKAVQDALPKAKAKQEAEVGAAEHADPCVADQRTSTARVCRDASGSLGRQHAAGMQAAWPGMPPFPPLCGFACACLHPSYYLANMSAGGGGDVL